MSCSWSRKSIPRSNWGMWGSVQAVAFYIMNQCLVVALQNMTPHNIFWMEVRSLTLQSVWIHYIYESLWWIMDQASSLTKYVHLCGPLTWTCATTLLSGKFLNSTISWNLTNQHRDVFHNDWEHKPSQTLDDHVRGLTSSLISIPSINHSIS